MQNQHEKVALLCGGSGREAEVSRESASNVKEALKNLGYECLLIEVSEDSTWIEKVSEADIALIMIHGTDGEDGYVQSVLRNKNIPYSGSGQAGSALAFNKILSKQLWKSVGGLTATCLSFNLENYEQIAEYVLAGISEVILPAVVKPNREGSSFGVHLVNTEEELLDAMLDVLQFDEKGMVEPLLEDVEFTLGFIDETYLGCVAVEAAEGFYDTHAKYSSNDTKYSEFEPNDLEKLIAHCRQFIEFAELEGPLRFDFKMHADRSYFLEVNTVPGMTSHSLLPMTAKQQGITFDALVDEIVLRARVK